MATGPHSQLDHEVEPCSTCEAKLRMIAPQTGGRCHGHRSTFPAGSRSRTAQQLRSETVNGDEREQKQHSDGRK